MDITKVDITKLEAERDALLNVLNCRDLDPVSNTYSEIRKAYDDIDKRCKEWYQMALDAKNIDLEYRKCETEEKVSKLQFFGGIGTAAITSAGLIISNLIKCKSGERVIKESTAEAFGMDQDKIQSRVASDVANKGFRFFYER